MSEFDASDPEQLAMPDVVRQAMSLLNNPFVTDDQFYEYAETVKDSYFYDDIMKLPRAQLTYDRAAARRALPTSSPHTADPQATPGYPGTQDELTQHQKVLEEGREYEREHSNREFYYYCNALPEREKAWVLDDTELFIAYQLGSEMHAFYEEMMRLPAHERRNYLRKLAAALPSDMHRRALYRDDMYVS